MNTLPVTLLNPIYSSLFLGPTKSICSQGIFWKNGRSEEKETTNFDSLLTLFTRRFASWSWHHQVLIGTSETGSWERWQFQDLIETPKAAIPYFSIFLNLFLTSAQPQTLIPKYNYSIYTHDNT